MQYKLITKKALQFFLYQTNMQIQKHLFKISERALKNHKARAVTVCIFSVTLILCIYYSLVFALGTFYILPSNTHLSECFQKSISQTQKPFKIQEDSIYMVFSKQIEQSKLMLAQFNNQTVIQNDVCIIIKDLNVQNFSQKPFEFTWTPNLLFFDSEERDIYKFTNYTIVFKSIPTLRHFFYGMNTLLTNQFIENPLGVFRPNMIIRSSTVSINSSLPQELSAKDKILRILKSFVYYIILSIVTSLYIYGTIISAPAVIIIFLRCSNFANQGGNMAQVYKIFPWIGIHSLIRETSQSLEIKKSARQICWAIIYYFFFLYFVYYAIILQVSTDIFYQKSELGLEQMLFGYIALVEFSAIVFMRTRPFLKYFPATHTLLMFMSILYCQFAHFGFKRISLMISFTASAALFAYMVLYLQIPAQTRWDRTQKYTPTSQRPRIGFLPLFNMNWINNLPDQWTLLFPLYGRQNFSQRELSFVDRNFQQLDQVFGNNPPQPVEN